MVFVFELNFNIGNFYMFIFVVCEKEGRMVLKKNIRKFMLKLGILLSFWIDLMWLNFLVGDMSVGR